MKMNPFGTLDKWAEIDNPLEYKELIEKETSKKVKKSKDDDEVESNKVKFFKTLTVLTLPL